MPPLSLWMWKSRGGGQKVDKLEVSPDDTPINKGENGANTRSAKPLCAGSIPARASKKTPINQSIEWLKVVFNSYA
jgi:hypothetical protein